MNSSRHIIKTSQRQCCEVCMFAWCLEDTFFSVAPNHNYKFREVKKENLRALLILKEIIALHLTHPPSSTGCAYFKWQGQMCFDHVCIYKNVTVKT